MDKWELKFLIFAVLLQTINRCCCTFAVLKSWSDGSRLTTTETEIIK